MVVPTQQSYQRKINAMPSWVYSMALFEGNENEIIFLQAPPAAIIGVS
jgi:hypothetical protein